MKLCGIHPKHQVLDNEAPKSHKNAIQYSGITYQLVQPDDHGHNITENKSKHGNIIFIGVMSVTASTFPMHQ